MPISFHKSDLSSAFLILADGNSSPSPLSSGPFIRCHFPRCYLLIETHPDHTLKLQPSLLINLILLYHFSFSPHIAYNILKHTSNSLIYMIILFLPSKKKKKKRSLFCSLLCPNSVCFVHWCILYLAHLESFIAHNMCSVNIRSLNKSC